jgi:hypothetical protein
VFMVHLKLYRSANRCERQAGSLQGLQTSSMGLFLAVASNTYGSVCTRLGTTPLESPCGCRASCIGDNLYRSALLNVLPCPLGANEGRERSLPCRREKGGTLGSDGEARLILP